MGKIGSVLAGSPGGPPYLNVSCRKMIVLVFASAGAYLLSWFYYNWWAIRLRTGRRISPIWRSLWFFLTAYPLLKGIKVTAQVQGVPARFSPLLICSAIPVLIVLSRFDDLLWPLAYLAAMPLIFVQRVVNRINTRMVPGLEIDGTYRGWERLVAFAGGPLVILALVGTYLVG
jgi:hypothetical protein